MKGLSQFLDAIKQECANPANVIYEPGHHLAGSIPISILPVSLNPLLEALVARADLLADLAGTAKNQNDAESYERSILGIYGILHLFREIYFSVMKLQQGSQNRESMDLLARAMNEVSGLL